MILYRIQDGIEDNYGSLDMCKHTCITKNKKLKKKKKNRLNRNQTE